MADDECPGADGLVCIGGWLYSQMSGRMMVFPANKRCPVCNPHYEIEEMTMDPAHYDQFWVKDVPDKDERRPFYTDDKGDDYDILAMISALTAIKANTAPNAISLSLENRIKAIYQLASEALP